MLLNCVVLEKTLESPLDCKEIQPVHPKGVLGGHWRDWCWSWNSNTLATWCNELTHLKRLWCWDRLKVGGEGDDKGWDCSMVLLTGRTWVWVDSRSWWWTWRPGMVQSMGSQIVRHDWMTELNWTELKLGHAAISLLALARLSKHVMNKDLAGKCSLSKCPVA